MHRRFATCIAFTVLLAGCSSPTGHAPNSPTATTQEDNGSCGTEDPLPSHILLFTIEAHGVSAHPESDLALQPVTSRWPQIYEWNSTEDAVCYLLPGHANDFTPGAQALIFTEQRTSPKMDLWHSYRSEADRNDLVRFEALGLVFQAHANGEFVADMFFGPYTNSNPLLLRADVPREVAASTTIKEGFWNPEKERVEVHEVPYEYNLKITFHGNLTYTPNPNVAAQYDQHPDLLEEDRRRAPARHPPTEYP